MLRRCSKPHLQPLGLNVAGRAEGCKLELSQVNYLVMHRMSLQMVVRVPPALPPRPTEPAVGAGNGQAVPDPKNKKATRGPSAWGFECFIQVRASCSSADNAVVAH